MEELARALVEAQEQGVETALCMVVESAGSTPREQGSKMLVYKDGHIWGTVGGGEMEERVIEEALASMIDGKARFLHYDLVDPSRGDPGVCGGEMDVYVEPVLPKPRLLIVGAGHVGKALAHLAKSLDFRVLISDDRPEYCNPQEIPDGDEFYPMTMEELVRQVAIDPRTYVALVTRNMQVDVSALPLILKSQAAYVGVIGSKRRWALTRKALAEAGVRNEDLDKVHSPIGLSIGAETPQEIAVSIMAEIISVKSSIHAKAISMKEA